MEYDVENRLTKVISASGTTEYKYDADGKRIKKLSSSETAIYVSASYEVRTTSVGAASGGEQKIIKHIFTGSDRTITVEKINGQVHTYYCHNDHLGSTNIITDENGFLVQQCEYTPYGELAQNTGIYNSPYKFTSKELDDFSGLYYYGARYYDPVLCHFIQADTIVPEPANPQSFNRYSYCDNNPINYTDPTGHSSWSKFWNKVEDFFEKSWEYVASSAIVVATSFAVIATGGAASPFMPMVIGEFIGGLTGGFAAYQQGGDIGQGIFAGTAIGGATAMASMGFKDYMLNAVFADQIITPFQGGMITAGEFAIGGFGAGLIEGYAGGARSWSDAFRHAGISAGFGAALGFAAGYSYTAGWQNFLHGADTQQHNWKQRIKNALKVSFEKICDVAGQFSKPTGIIKQLKSTVEIYNSIRSDNLHYLSERYGYVSDLYERGTDFKTHNSEIYRNKRWVEYHTAVEQNRR